MNAVSHWLSIKIMFQGYFHLFPCLLLCSLVINLVQYPYFMAFEFEAPQVKTEPQHRTETKWKHAGGCRYMGDPLCT